MDKITLDRINLLHPKLRAEVIEIYKEICEKLEPNSGCRFTHTYRSIKEQDAIYAQGRSTPGKVVTWAKGGDSYHNYGLALDIVLLLDINGDGIKEVSWDTVKDYDGDHKSDWREIVEVFTKYGWEWGGNWNSPKTDTPHFQKSLGYSVVDLKNIYKINKTYIDSNCVYPIL
jgi:peptidoglycan L-alanyl-D-glutamate endopeptidase CwlK